jgi:hypothetical protein|nr:BPSL0067 family protein [Kofleriaceae bacterium]
MRIASLFLFVLAASSTGCLSDGTDPDDHDLVDGETMVEVPEQPEPAAVTADALHRIYATDANLNIFRHGCFSDTTFDWSCSSHLDGDHANFTHKERVDGNDVEVGDNSSLFWGECVSLVKAATKNNTTTSGWVEGAGVFTGLRSGTAIATFPGGHYDGHTAIFLGEVKNSAGAVVGMRIADQNWGARVVKRHVIYRTGSGVLNANSYHAILVH